MMQISIRYIAVVTLLSGAIGGRAIALRRPTDTLAQPLSSISRDIAGWHAANDNVLPSGELAQLRPTGYLSRMYKHGPDELGLFIAYYAQQKAGESMHSPKHCLPGSGWEIWDYASTAIPTIGTPTTVNRYSIANSGQRMVVLYWYQSRNRIITSEYAGKLYLLKDGIVDGRTSGSLVRITVPDTPEAIKAAERFASQLIPLLNNCLGGTISA